MNAAGCGDENIAALTSVMDLKSVSVKCSLLEIDAWKNICEKSDVIKTLHFRWDPQCDSLRSDKVKGFFHSLMNENKTIETIKLDFFHGEAKLIKDRAFKNFIVEEIEQFADYVGKGLRKKGLKSLQVNVQIIEPPEDIKDVFSTAVVDKIVHVFNAFSRDIKLAELHLDIDMDTHLEKLVESMMNVRSLRKLALLRISSGYNGFSSLTNLILEGNIVDFEISLNMTRYWNSVLEEMRRKDGISVGSPKMFEYPMSKVGELVFDKTMPEDDDNNEENVTVFATDAKNDADAAGFLNKMKVLLGEINMSYEVDDYYYTEHNGVVFPFPICTGHKGKASGFHCIFSALRDKQCRLQSFHLNRCLLSRQAEYFSCLGYHLMDNTTVTKLKIDNILPTEEQEGRKIQFTLPLFIGLCRKLISVSCQDGK